MQGTATDKVDQMAGVEDVHTPMDNNLVRFVARSVEDPSKLGDIRPGGFRDERMLDGELAEEGGGRWWDFTAHSRSTRRAKKMGFVSTLTRAVSLLPEGKPLWGGPCQKMDIDEVDVRLEKGSYPE